MSKLKLLLAAAALSGFAASPAMADSKTFGNPKVGGNRLDWCYGWATGCGAPAADAFCKKQGYTNATAFDQDADIGDASPTRVISTGQICDAPDCDGFAFIKCEKVIVLLPPKKIPLPVPPPPLPPAAMAKDFMKPKYNGVRLDFCFAGDSGCGQKAADAFCDSVGFEEADDYTPAMGIGPLKPTVQIGTGQVKVKALANAFKKIRCVK